MFKKLMFCVVIVCFSASAQNLYANIADTTNVYKFDLGSGKVADGFTKVDHKCIYQDDSEYGLVCDSKIVSKKRPGKDDLTRDYITSDAPILFMLKIPSGRYKVTVTLGDPKGESETTVKAESRRLMLENIKTEYGQVITKSFIVDVRTPILKKWRQIWLNSREFHFLNWDNRITLEFNGSNPCVSSVKIEPIEDLPAIILIGNSTVTDQEYEPWAAWGQMITRFLKPDVVLANYAQSGETLLSFRKENRLRKVLKEMHKDDYVLIQLGTNDKGPGEFHVEPYTGYKEQLEYFIDTIRAKGGKPILVTPINFRSFDEDGKIINRLGEYPDAMRLTAKEKNVPLIDLHAMSKTLFEAMGSEGAKKAFVVFPAHSFPNQEKALNDGVHQSPYGAYELAKCIVQWIVEHDMELKQYIIDDFPHFDISNPDKFDDFRVPYSPTIDLNQPLQRM